MKKRLLSSSVIACLITICLQTKTTSAAEITAEPSTGQTPVQANFTLSETFPPPTPPYGNDGGADKPTNITGPFGIAYIPETLSCSAKLTDSNTNQSISLTNSNSLEQAFNVGVRDKTRQDNASWSLKARLEWSGKNAKYMDGTSITYASEVRLNEAGTITSTTPKVIDVGNNSIKQGTEVPLMTAQPNHVMNDLFNYNMYLPKLNIPNPNTVLSGDYSGQIIWNLENGPVIS